MRFQRCVIGLVIVLLAVASLSATKSKAQGQQTRPEVLVRYMEGDHWQFRHIASDGTATDLLTDAPPFIFVDFLMVSPDRQWLYFSGALPEDLTGQFVEPVSYPQRVYRVPLTGGVPEVIIDTPSGGSDFYRFFEGRSHIVAPTPDGEYLVYQPVQPNADGWRGLWRIRADGTDNLELSAGITGQTVRSYEWVLSDDGQWVYFGVDPEESPTFPVYRTRLDGSMPPELVTEVEYPAVWHIQGNWLFESHTQPRVVSLTDGSSKKPFEASGYVFASLEHAFVTQDIAVWRVVSPDDQWDVLEAVRLSDGTSLWKLTAKIIDVVNDEWLILSARVTDGPPQLLRMRPDGGEQTIFRQEHPGWLRQPVFAGDWLILDAGGEVDRSIWGINVMSGEERMFWENPNPQDGLVFAMSASPDGAWVVFANSNSGGDQGGGWQLSLISMADNGATIIHSPEMTFDQYSELAVWFLE